MARLQDFQTVTPTSSDNILIVQSTGQGLASVGSTLGAKMDKANPTGTGSLSLNRASGSTVGTNSVAVGNNNTSSGASSTAIGISNTASGNGSHAEGYSNTASGDYSHAEGRTTSATYDYAHSEGGYSVASGSFSHAEGVYTIANHKSQHVLGEYNIADTSAASVTARGNYAEIVGNGTAENARSNARTLDWSGNETIAGDLIYNGSTSLTSMISAITGYFTLKSESITVTFDSTGEGTLYNSLKNVLYVADDVSPSDGKYIGYFVFPAGNMMKVKNFNRASTTFTSTIVSTTRKVKAYYFDAT